MIRGLDINDPVLSLDLSTACVGWCLLEGNDYLTGHLDLEDDFQHRLSVFRSFLFKHINSHRPAVVVPEAIFMGRGPESIKLIKMHGVMDQALHQYTGLYAPPIHASTWKSKVFGDGKITTKQKQGGLIVRMLCRMGFHVKHIDEADALAIALCFRKMHFGQIEV